MKDTEINGKDQIIKSTFLMGGASAFNIAFGALRHKIIAILVSSEGVGILGIYQSLSNLLVTIFGLGINESGARQIAISDSINEHKVSETYLSIKRIAIVTGILGITTTILLSKGLSLFAFKNSKHYIEIIFLSFVILLSNLYGAQTALIQGKRKIYFLAKIGILGPMWGTLLSLPLIYLLKLRALISYFIIMAFTNLISSWWYSRKIKLEPIKLSWISSIRNGVHLAEFGSAIMLGTLLGSVCSFLIQILIARAMGLESVGIYQASSIFSTLYVGILLRAMVTDFYPRLSAAYNNNIKLSNIVNDQIEAGLLLALPGVLLTLTFASSILLILYTRAFLPGILILRWQILGVLIQVISWPLGYVLRAQGAGRLFLLTETIYNLSYLIFIVVGMEFWDLAGIGIAFFISNLIYLLIICIIVSRKYKIKLNKNVSLLSCLSFSLSIFIMGVSSLIPNYSIFINILLIFIISFYSYKRLNLKLWLIKLVNKFK
ncbi:MAG: oligosaccharide flippase family protein [Candidatus Aminicenantes bacterium]|nr:oligosaccharide flippase family protein [Candidatus Aminicenantes bacterium]